MSARWHPRRELGAGVALVAALLVSLAPAAAGTGAQAAEPGVTAAAVVVAGTAPLTGVAAGDAAIARGAQAYLAHVNARGGINGRRIVYRYADDASDPAQAVQAARALVGEGVLAFFNTIGTAQSLALRSYLHAAGVPQLFVASGSSAWARDGGRYPGALGFRPSFAAEGWIYGAYLARARGRARVAVLVQDDADGRDLLGGLERGARGSGVRIVAIEPHAPTSPDAQAELTRLAATRADTLVLLTTAPFASEAFAVARRLAWRPHVILASTAASADVLAVAPGTITAGFLKDPADPAWRDDPGLRLYRSILAARARGARASDARYVQGMAAAHTLVEALARTGPDLGRAALVRQSLDLRVSTNPFLLPGIGVRTGPLDRRPVEQLRLHRRQRGRWVSFGGVWSARSG